MIRRPLLLLICILSFFTNAQSILVNGDFEDGNAAWGTIKTVDFFGTPLGNLGTMTAQSGTRFCGLRFHSAATASEDWQEYIRQNVYGDLNAGAVYKVSIHYCIADMCTRTTDDFGVAFTENPFAFSGANPSAWLATLTPQIRLEDGDFPIDDVNWRELSGYYQASGNEIYTIVGCFKDDGTLDTIGIQSDYHFTQADVYFFIDNFSISECIDYPQVDMEEEVVLCEPGEVTLDAYYPGASYVWSTGDTTNSITTSIDQSTYISVRISKNGCTYEDSTKITLFNEGTRFDDVWFCGNDEFPIERSVPLNQNELIVWDDGSLSASRLIHEPGQYAFTKTLDNCSYSDTFQVLVFKNDVYAYPNPGVDEINFINSNDINVRSILSNDGRLISSNLVDDELLDLTIEQLSPGLYFLILEENGCSVVLKYEKLLIE